MCGPILDASARTDGTLTLASGQTLRCDTGGSIKGNVVASSGSTITPGGGYYIMTMTCSNNLTFQAGSTCVVDLNTDTATNDVFIVTGALTYGGTLQINHVGTSAYAAGQSFKVFTAGSYAGSFASITPSVPSAGLVWDTSALSSGALKIATDPRFTIPQSYLDGSGNLVLQVPNSLVGKNYVLLTSTNVAMPLASWTPVTTNAGTGGSLTNLISVTGNPAGFYRYQIQ